MTESLGVIADYDQIHRIAHTLQNGTHTPFCFTDPDGFFPPVGHPRTVEYFFTVVMHQYGFWHLENDRWSGSMYAAVDGIRLKGSDFVWRSATKSLLAGEEYLTRFLDDEGNCPLPMRDSHRDLAEKYRAHARINPPDEVLQKANASHAPLKTLLATLTQTPGYSEDRYAKKAMLLAMTLAQRPERFLRGKDGSNLDGWTPVVDYHIQRTALRTGMTVPLDKELRNKLENRVQLSADDEDLVRRATYEAVEELSRVSGISHGAIDILFFQARTRCPEIEEPDCDHCPLDKTCAKQKKLFQPVFRTTAY